MGSRLLVYLDGRHCGEIRQSTKGNLSFHYDESYRASPDATPLSLSLPLVQPDHPKRAVLPFLDGLLTDNEAARAAIARNHGVNPNNPFAILAHVGADVAGALQILPPDEVSTDGSLPRGGSAPVTETQVAQLLDGVVAQFEGGRGPLREAGRYSLAGAQPKLALLRTPTGWAIPTGSTPTTHILKPAAGGFNRLDVVEHLTMRVAALLGLTTATTELAQIGDHRVMVTTRYDRVQHRGRWRRLHQEDLGQALSVPPHKKYQHQDGGPGVAEVARLLRGLARIEDRGPAAWAFFRGLMFNVVLHCTDAHIKNYSVLLDGPTVRLAPLYDLATYAPYDDGANQASSAMRIGQHYRFSAIGEEDILQAARLLSVPPAQALGFVGHLRIGAVGAFETARDELAGADPGAAAVATATLAAVSRLPGLRA
ncbi:MAG: type II toxin-antitoxin system HipA family toxin [Propionibacteriaceae bacterium]|jgi:serine/threonine-protein kinase HipA|nr:type II toxin-antitoxin system HipA family toxin [Propionibacteriaceae bacterium]